MVSLLKTFGKGVLYVIGLPFFILALLLFAIYGLGAFLFQAIKSIIYFFTGQRFFPELPEDKELRLLREGATNQNNAQPVNEDNNPKEDSIIFHYEEEKPVEEEQPAQQDKPVFEEKPVFNNLEEACFHEEKPVEEATTTDEVEEVEVDILNDVLNPGNDEPAEETIGEEPQEETVLETAEPKQDEDDLVEELETYVPRSSNYTASEDDDDDTDSGVDIDYDYKV